MQRRLSKLVWCAAALLAVACAATRGSIGAILAQDRGDGKLVVREAPASMTAARAGIEVGDEILTIDGRDVRSMSLAAIHDALQGDVGTKVALTVQRRGEIRRISVERGPFEPKR
jgi:C-terminal processing protease CtpA/Prc